MNKTDIGNNEAKCRTVKDHTSGQKILCVHQSKPANVKPVETLSKDEIAANSSQANRRESGAQNQAVAAAATTDGKASKAFITDIEPFLFGRPITYIDVGANVGAVMHEILHSSITVREAHLIEPNPQTFAALQKVESEFSKVKYLSCHNVAVDAIHNKVTMRDEGTMTHVVTTIRRKETNLSERVFEVETITLDELVRQCEIRHVNLLKVDVEGHELAVLEGARKLLKTQHVDIIYIEAGLNPNSKQQTYYRIIEDTLNSHGYHLFRIYEQKNEWLDDSPFLRRVNLSFMSTRFANANPYKVTQELFKTKKRLNALTQLLEITRTELAERNRVQETAEAETAKLHAKLDKRSTEIATLIEHAEALTEKIAALRRRTKKLQHHNEKLLKSTSWKITAPARKVMTILRRKW